MNDKSCMLSVCIPTYNRYPLLVRALDSVLAQDFRKMEVIISDNCSTDGSWPLTEQLAGRDPRIIVNRNGTNLGWAGNLNACIGRARGTYILFLCDDDELMPGMLKKTVAFLEEHDTAGLVHCNGWVSFPDGSERLRKTQTVPLLPAGTAAITKIMLKNTLIFSSVVVRKACFDRLGLFTETCSADWEMWARIGKSYDIGHIAKPLIRVHVHAFSSNHPASFYERDWTFLGERILSYLPDAEQLPLRPRLRGEIAHGLFQLGIQAWQQGQYRRGQEFLLAAARHENRLVWMYRYAQAVLLALPRYLLWKKRGTRAHVSNV
ncbi:MAG: glycosyltransferase family 2 protein [Nitrospiraceae bacterium]|nr:glycosyltransferase family 2 protein [Nitrospiraceae bacterium]